MDAYEHLTGSEDGSVIATTGLTKRFGARLAVDGADLRVPAASAFGFLGPNGAGKTTMIRMLLGLTRPNAGSMRLLGLPVPERRAEALRRVGGIVEEPRFHPHLTGRENLQVIAAAREPEADARIGPSLERVGLAERADDRVGAYSMGMRQRLGIARCLLADPALLILDEPMNGLDPAGIQEFRQLIRSFVDEGRTVFLSSHLLDEVEKTCDAVAIVDQGKILMQGSIDDVVASDQRTVAIGCDDPSVAEDILSAHRAVRSIGRTERGIRVTLTDIAGQDADHALADLNTQLVMAGVAVYRIEPSRVSLEERFLDVTSRLGGDR
jgi:ABC-2 type transport system ATP-binding protein